MFASVTKMKYFRNISSIMCGVNAKPAKGLCNLLIFNKLQVIAVGKRPRLRRDCDLATISPISFSSSCVGKRPRLRRDCDKILGGVLWDNVSRKETSIKKGLRPHQGGYLATDPPVGKRPRLRRDCDHFLFSLFPSVFPQVGKRPRLRRDCDTVKACVSWRYQM